MRGTGAAMLQLSFAPGVFNYRVVGVLIKDGEVLVHREHRQNFWALPGGRCEFGETSQRALEREFLEEIGARISVGRLLWVVENFFHTSGRANHEIGFYYEIQSETLLPREESFLGRTEDRTPPLVFRWVPLSRLRDLRLYPSFLRDGLQHLPTEIAHVVHRDAEDA